jgi:hypothetical protein
VAKGEGPELKPQYRKKKRRPLLPGELGSTLVQDVYLSVLSFHSTNPGDLRRQRFRAKETAAKWRPSSYRPSAESVQLAKADSNDRILESKGAVNGSSNLVH